MNFKSKTETNAVPAKLIFSHKAAFWEFMFKSIPAKPENHTHSERHKREKLILTADFDFLVKTKKETAAVKTAKAAKSEKLKTVEVIKPLLSIYLLSQLSVIVYGKPVRFVSYGLQKP